MKLPRLSRRGLLAGAAALVAAAGGSMALLDRPASRERWIERKLAWHFSYLDIDPSAIRTFIEQYEQHRGRIGESLLKVIVSPLPDDVCTRFLASTDFFQNGADESKPVKFVALYDPYVSLCYNPFLKR